MKDTQYLSISSGGTKGIMYFGMLDALEDHMGPGYYEWCSGLKGVVGTSAGAIATLAVVLQLTKEQRRRFMDEMADMHNLFNPDVALLVKDFGVEDGRRVRDLLRRARMTSGLAPECTLRDLKRFLGVEYVTCATDIHHSVPFFFSATHTPDATVVDAVFASCSVPFMFTPPKFEGHLLSDGCLSSDYPNLFEEDKTFFVRLTSRSEDFEISSWPEFLGAIIFCAVNAQKEKWERICARCDPENVLDITPFEEVNRMKGFNIEQTEAQAKVLYESGYICTFDHMHHGNPSKRLGEMVSSFMKMTSSFPEKPPDLMPVSASPTSGIPVE